jgi:hypothetical protein
MKLAILSCAIASVAAADNITFTHQGEGMGNIGGVPFNFTIFTIHATADTDDVQSLGFGWWVDHQTASIDIMGVGNFEFLTPTRHFVNNGAQLVGFSRAGMFGDDLFNGPNNAVFGAWDMTTSIGPIQGTGGVLQWNVGDIVTDAGVLNMLDGGAFAIFTAEVGGCLADCNGDGVLNILDFVCFQGLFQTQAPEADCNDDGAYNILDFVCFQGEFQQGCN